MRTLQPKILEIPGTKWNGKKTCRKKFFENLGVPREVDLFNGNFRKMLFHSLLEVVENSKPTFWLNGKRPMKK